MKSIVFGLLICICLPVTQGAESKTPRQRYDALIKEYEAEEVAWTVKYGAGQLNDPQAQLIARYRDWPGWSFAVRFLEFAEANPDDPAAGDALIWIVNQATSVGVGDRQLVPMFGRAFHLLSRGQWLDDKRVIEACRRSFRYASPWTEGYLRTVLEKSHNADVRGVACLHLARLLANRTELHSNPWFAREPNSPFEAFLRQRLDAFYMAYVRGTDPQATDDEAGRLFERSIREFGGVNFRRATRLGRPDVITVADAARLEMAELGKPAIGRQAPEIEGKDVEGKSFKLSNFRGKVVVLSFAGHWSGPCREKYPLERQLVATHREQPFVLLSVDNDKDSDEVRKAVKDGEITWRCWLDGGLGGPIATAWGVTSFPTVFVLDHRGVICHKDPSDDQMKQAVEALLESTRTSTN
jgi:peroxiredoxin